jgi:hypothetical protein
MRRSVAPGRLVVVGGHSRGVGKTSVIEHLLDAHRAERWIAIKISAHRHAPEGVSVPLVEECHQWCDATQTGRYLAAGASRAFLVRAPDASLARAATFINGLREGGRTVLVESNRIVQWLIPDVLLFVVDPMIEDWKPSSAFCLPVADAVIHRSQAATLRLDDSVQFPSHRAAFDRAVSELDAHAELVDTFGKRAE